MQVQMFWEDAKNQNRDPGEVSVGETSLFTYNTIEFSLTVIQCFLSRLWLLFILLGWQGLWKGESGKFLHLAWSLVVVAGMELRASRMSALDVLHHQASSRNPSLLGGRDHVIFG